MVKTARGFDSIVDNPKISRRRFPEQTDCFFLRGPRPDQSAVRRRTASISQRSIPLTGTAQWVSIDSLDATLPAEDEGSQPFVNPGNHGSMRAPMQDHGLSSTSTFNVNYYASIVPSFGALPFSRADQT